jgi:hypothetical protein
MCNGIQASRLTATIIAIKLITDMSPTLPNDTQKSKPRPGYFIVRTTGEVVPLIAVDELPLGTDLLGVPRSLNLEATIGMLNLGLQKSSGSFYQIYGSRDKDSPTTGVVPRNQ